ncbi:MAG: hypothetical protein H5T50_08335 [Nitrososphaeria archaeon]|nr:hypothetical protein [Nitrososphaeria archaeon]
MDDVEPFILYFSKRFVDKLSKTFGLGLIVRKPLVEIFKKMGYNFVELDRDQAKEALERFGKSEGITVSLSQLIESLTLAFFLPTGLFLATLKKVYYRSGIETKDNIILEFLAEIPRAFKPTLFYDIWLIVPKNVVGEEDVKRILKMMVERTGETPLTDEEWENVKPIIEKLKGKLEIKGVAENLWKTMI